MSLSDRRLGYAVLAASFLVLLFLGLVGSLFWEGQKSQQIAPPSPSASPTKETPSAPKTIPPPLAAFLKQHPDELQAAARAVEKWQKAGLVDYWISPDGMSALVHVEPKCWYPLLHKDKETFVQIFLVFFLGYNLDHPGPGEVPFFSVLNMSTRERLARAYLNSGEIEIFK